MKLLVLILSFSIGFSLFAVDSSPSDSVKTREEKPYFGVSWAPVGLSLLSVSLMVDSSKYGLQKLIRDPFNEYKTNLEDYIQYAPIAMMYTADLFKVKSKNTVWNQTKFLAFSEAGTAAIVHLLKNTLKVQRPNNGSFNSYPSGHTSQAFVASQVLYNEYRETAPLLAYSGYLFSISTGALRIVNNRHWLPDVLLGAGIAMLVTNTVYYFEPLKDWNPFKSKKNKLDASFIPSLREEFVGGYLTIRF